MTDSAPKLPMPNVSNAGNSAKNRSANLKVKQKSSPPIIGPRVFRTVLITDSILGHVKNIDILGMVAAIGAADRIVKVSLDLVDYLVGDIFVPESDCELSHLL